MPRSIFVNLPVSDLDRSKAFYEALGFAINPQFTDENAACVVISDTIYCMLLRSDYFKTFLPKGRSLPVDPAAAAALVALSCDSRADVDAMMAAAAAGGGADARAPQDLGFMYQRTFADPDGHLWEPFWMDSAHIQQSA